MKNSILKIDELIVKRRSPVTFSKRPVEKEKLELLFEAARWAPSSYNQQPWRFIYATKENPEDYNLLFDCLVEGNKEWAHQAPVLVLSIAEVISNYNKKENYYAFYDTGMAVGNLLIQATSMDLYVHQMGGYNKNRVRQNLKIPYGFELAAMMALGYLGDIKSLSNHLKERETAERKRNSINNFAFKGKWGN